MSGDWGAVEEAVELLQEGATEEAIRLLLELIQTGGESDNEYAHYFLGNAYFESESWEPALKCYVRAIELQPEYIGAMVGCGHTLRQLGRFDDAIRMGRRALLMRKEDPDALYLLGAVHFQRGETAAAEKHLRAYLETNPELEIRLEVEGMLQVLAGEVQSPN